MTPGALDPLTEEMVYMAVSVTNNCALASAKKATSGAKKRPEHAQAR